ncbi:MAG: hypothetical protein K5756_10255 [Clostridiales bacterium]|nr:hypothetical protein [Clostridiales bacterium]
MKNTFKKLVSVILVVLMTFALSAPAFAATKDTVKQYGKEGGYLAIGDSLSRGCGAEGFYLDRDKNEYGQYELFSMRNVQGAIPTQIAQAVGCTMPDDMADRDATFWPCCYPGMTVAMMLDLMGVDDGFKDEKLNYAYYKDMLRYFGYEGSFDGVRQGHVYVEGEDGQCGNIIELIKNADLITVQLGMCDIFYRAYRIVSNGGMLKDGLKFDLSSLDSIKALLETAVKEMKFGYDYWETHYTVLLEKIIELNPDATIVMVGSFNVVNQLTLTDDTVFPLGSLFSAITDSMNKRYKEWEKKYGVIYADIANTETLAAENDWSVLGDFKKDSLISTHPGQNGYDYIVRQILAQLPEKDDSKDLRIDLGRFTEVDSVAINGIPVRNYTMDGFVLNIPYSALLAGNLVIKINNDDGTTAMQLYKISRDKDKGYTAYRVWGTNDIKGKVLSPANLLIKLFKTLFDKIAGLFKK